MLQCLRVDAPIFVEQHMSRLRDQVTSVSFGEALLEASRRLVEEGPGVLLADGRVEGLENLFEVDTLSLVQGELGPPRGIILAHHRTHGGPGPPIFHSQHEKIFTIGIGPNKIVIIATPRNVTVTWRAGGWVIARVRDRSAFCRTAQYVRARRRFRKYCRKETTNTTALGLWTTRSGCNYTRV